MAGFSLVAALLLRASSAVVPESPLLDRLRRAMPDAAVAKSLAGELVREGRPEGLEQACAAEPALDARAQFVIAAALRAEAPGAELSIGAYWAAFQRARIGRLSASTGSWSRQTILSCADGLLLDRGEMEADRRFRAAVVTIIARSWDRSASRDLRDLLLFEIDRASGIDFSSSETIRRAWGVIDRTSADRRIAYTPGRWRFPRDSGGELSASVYSLPSDIVEPEDARRFLTAVRALSPQRALLAVVDPLMAIELAGPAAELRFSLLNARGRVYTPWPRDTFSLVRSPRGEIGILVRPDSRLQGSRREDNFLGREILDDLPADVDDAWGHPRWSSSPVPFHNGQVLLDSDHAWISLHTLEPRILEMLHEPRVPVASFQAGTGISRYVDAARRAAAELSRLYDRPIRWIHPLAGEGDLSARRDAMATIGGGAGFDLDSYLTIVDREGGPGTVAILGSLAEGEALVAQAPAEDLRRFAEAFHLSGETDQIRARILRGTAIAACVPVLRLSGACRDEPLAGPDSGVACSTVPGSGGAPVASDA